METGCLAFWRNAFVICRLMEENNEQIPRSRVDASHFAGKQSKRLASRGARLA